MPWLTGLTWVQFGPLVRLNTITKAHQSRQTGVPRPECHTRDAGCACAFGGRTSDLSRDTTAGRLLGSLVAVCGARARVPPPLFQRRVEPADLSSSLKVRVPARYRPRKSFGRFSIIDFFRCDFRSRERRECVPACYLAHRRAARAPPMPVHAVPAAASLSPSPPLLLPPPVPYAAAEPRFRRCVRKFFAHLFSNLGLFGLVAGYVIVGAFVFRFLEAGNEREERDRIAGLKNDCLGELWNITGRSGTRVG